MPIKPPVSNSAAQKTKTLAGVLKVDAVGSDSSWTQAQRSAFTAFISEQLTPPSPNEIFISKKHMGDGFLLSMPSIESAAIFALKLLGEILSNVWPDSETNGPPEIRCALHVAEIEVFDISNGEKEISGEGVNWVCRIEPIAPSGTLTCTEAAQLTLDGKSSRFSFKDLGIHDLPKKSGKARLYQVEFHTSQTTKNKAALAKAQIHTSSNADQGVHLPQRHIISSKNLRNILCFHQGNVLEFFFLTAGRHKALRIAMESKGRGKKERIREAEKQLKEYIASELESIYFDSFNSIIDCYFKNRRAAPPRICVKGYFDFHSKALEIQPIARSSEVSYGKSPKKTTVKTNTGFFEVQAQKKAYMCNDILEDITAKKYIHNPRIDIEKIMTDAASISKEKVRASWSKYWDKGNENPAECYQSTLIVPMTLINNRLSHEFKKEFKIDNFDKTIFGFLCFDHAEKDYFLQDEDEDIGYFLADILSLYQVVALGFTHASKTYNSAASMLK